MNNLDKYMNQNQNNPEYLFHGSPLLLEKLEPRESHDSDENIENIDKAVFVTSSFITASAYAFKDTIKKLSDRLHWNFIVSQAGTMPIMEMANVITNDAIEGYIYVFKNNNLFKNDPPGSNQYKYYSELIPIDVIKIKYKDYKNYYKINNSKKISK